MSDDEDELDDRFGARDFDFPDTGMFPLVVFFGFLLSKSKK
jgi:hypothetical protein